MLNLRRPSPALVVAVIALFVALSGTAAAAGVVPLAKKALFAKNAAKLQGKTAAQVAAIPGPARTAAALVSTASTAFSLAPSEEKDVGIQCDSGAKAVSGGFTTPNAVIAADTRPSVDGTGWAIYLINLSSTQGASGTADAVCLH